MLRQQSSGPPYLTFACDPVQSPKGQGFYCVQVWDVAYDSYWIVGTKNPPLISFTRVRNLLASLCHKREIKFPIDLVCIGIEQGAAMWWYGAAVCRKSHLSDTFKSSQPSYMIWGHTHIRRPGIPARHQVLRRALAEAFDRFVAVKYLAYFLQKYLSAMAKYSRSDNGEIWLKILQEKPGVFCPDEKYVHDISAWSASKAAQKKYFCCVESWRGSTCWCQPGNDTDRYSGENPGTCYCFTNKTWNKWTTTNHHRQKPATLISKIHSTLAWN